MNAREILLQRGRGYLYKGRYPQIVVFTRAVLDVDKLESCYGGHHYRHKSGFIWLLSDRKSLRACLESLEGVKSRHGFEDILGRLE